MEKVKKLTKLTEEQKAQIGPCVAEWIKIGLNTEPLDRAKAVAAMEACYRTAALTVPTVAVCVSDPLVGALAAPLAASLKAIVAENPGEGVKTSEITDKVSRVIRKHNNRVAEVVAAVEAAVGPTISDKALQAFNDRKNSDLMFWHSWFGGQLWAHWAAYENFLLQRCGLSIDEKLEAAAKVHEESVKQCCYWWPNCDFIMYSERPSVISMNASGKLHCTTGEALKWASGYGLYALNGVVVPEWLVMTPRHELDCQVFLKLTNAEVRREFIRKIGVETLCKNLGSKVIDKKDTYELHLVDLKGTTGEWPYLLMLNPSISTYHMECVDKSCKTVEQALAWRNSMDKYTPPEVLT